MGAQIASGLAAVHAAGTAHGALAPESILVADTGTGPFAKISGLGMSPATDAATDVHSLGAALSAAVGGRAPETLAPLLRQLTTDRHGLPRRDRSCGAGRDAAARLRLTYAARSATFSATAAKGRGSVREMRPRGAEPSGCDNDNSDALAPFC
jgi:hypothetical protein